MNHLCGCSNSLIHTLSLDTTLTREAPYRLQSEQSAAVHWLIFSRIVFLSHTVSHAITLIACSLPPHSPNSHRNTRSVFPTLAAFHPHTGAHNPRLTGLFVTEVWRPRTVTFWHTVFTLAGTQTLSRTHSHTFFIEGDRLTDCRPTLLEGPFFECGYSYVFDCTLSVCVCVTVTGSYQDKAQPAAQGCRGHRGEGGGRSVWVLEWNSLVPIFSFLFFSQLSVPVDICLHSLFTFSVSAVELKMVWFGRQMVSWCITCIFFFSFSFICLNLMFIPISLFFICLLNIIF